jgi:hypothetical protein
MRHWTAVFFLLAFCEPTAGQVIFESSSGSSSIVLNNVGAAGINFGDKSVKLGYLRQVSGAPLENWLFGFNLEAKAVNGFAELFEDSRLSAKEGSGSLLAGYSWESEDPRIIYSLLAGQLRYTRSDLPLAGKSDAGVTVVENEVFSGLVAGLYYNTYLASLPVPGEFLVGIGARYGDRNNFESLKKGEVCEEIPSPVDQEANVRAQSCKDARFGDYKEASEVSADLDVLWYQTWAKNRIAFGFLGRYDGAKEDRFVPGVGVFLTKEKAPLKVLGGLTLERKEGDWRVGFQVGIPLP